MSEKLNSVDLNALNDIAAGNNKKTPRIVASGIGGKLMGTKSLVDVTAKQMTEDLRARENNQVPLSLAERDQKEREKYEKVPHISDQPWTLSNWYLHLNWLNVMLVVGIPMYGLYEASKFFPHWKTIVLAMVLHTFNGISITAGYHRYFSHKSYEAAIPVRLFYAFFGAAAIEGSIKWWAHGHRIHHRFTDTKRDPHDASQGLWYCHLGWMLVKPNPRHRARADISDLTKDWVVRYQHQHYLSIMLFLAFVFPTLIAGYFWGDYWGGFIYSGIVRVFTIQQVTFCVNSLAHYVGAQPFDDRRTPRDHVLTALITFGEGYHNYHHEFPTDYRNAIKWYQYDPTKVTIWLLSKVGLTWNLKTFPENTVAQGIYQQKLKKLNQLKAQIKWGHDVSKLPVWDEQEFNERGKKEGLILISGIIHDAKLFVKDHPGGQALIRASLGKDASEAFNGAVYAHSNAAHNLLANMRVAVLSGSNPQNNTFAVQQEYLSKQMKL